MTKTHRTFLAMTLTVICGAAGDAAQENSTLSAQDRAEIQALVTHYAHALSTCDAEEYADLFATPGGYFASGTRGEVRERENLIKLVRSEARCWPSRASAGAQPVLQSNGRGTSAGPIAVIEPAPEGARGTVYNGSSGGRYEDVYIKTPKGWRFKSRNVITDEAAAAGLTSKDFVEIRQLAGDDHGHYEDVYGAKGVATPAVNGGTEQRPFRASGLVITITPTGATGRAYLRNDGGYYDDVYVKTPQGWRIKSRTYVELQENAATRAQDARRESETGR